jgi:hypothetical protein
MAERFTEFDASKVGEALGAEPRTSRDVAHGDGEALNVGEAVLEVYPDAGVTRVTTPDARIELSEFQTTRSVANALSSNKAERTTGRGCR